MGFEQYNWGFTRDKISVGGAPAVFRPHPQPLSHGVGEGSRVPATRCGFPLSRVAGEGAGGEGCSWFHLNTLLVSV